MTECNQEVFDQIDYAAGPYDLPAACTLGPTLLRHLAQRINSLLEGVEEAIEDDEVEICELKRKANTIKCAIVGRRLEVVELERLLAEVSQILGGSRVMNEQEMIDGFIDHLTRAWSHAVTLRERLGERLDACDAWVEAVEELNAAAKTSQKGIKS